MNIFIAPEKSMTPNERAEALVAGLLSHVNSLEAFMRAYPLVDFRAIEKDLMDVQDRVVGLAVKADKSRRNEELDAIIDAGGLST